MQGPSWTPPNPAARAVGVRRADQAICLPTDLLAYAPECAIGCILEFTQLNYGQNLCPFTSSLTYLCTSPTTSGLTIGEGSLQCLVSRCTGDDLKKTGVYNICNNVPGAIAETVDVITATIEPATTVSAMATPFPPTIGNPASTQEVTSIVMASGVPSIAPAGTTLSQTDSILPSMETSQSSATRSSTQPGSSSSAIAASDKVSSTPGLSSAQITGIGVGAALVALLILAIVFWHCQRREKLQKRRSMRSSMHGARTPPPTYGGLPPELPVTTKIPDNGFLAAPFSHRFYAGAPAEEKRRSFWRRSIKPEDIGVAVAPNVDDTGSPASYSSQQSLAKLLPKKPEKLPSRPTYATPTLWPAPLNPKATRNRQSRPSRPVSQSTIFDEDVEANAVIDRPRSPNVPLPLTDASLNTGKGGRHLPTPLELNPVKAVDLCNSLRTKEASPTSLIPLTPTYDNGNVVSQQRAHPPSSWKQMRHYGELVSLPNPPAPLEENCPAKGAQPQKSVLRKKYSTRTATKAGPASEPRVIPARKDSEVSNGTEIEEDTTPEEIEKKLEMLEKPKPAAILIPDSHSFRSGPRSPISNLTYPPIPRSAGVSSQAEHVPRLLNSLRKSPIPPKTGPSRPTRDQLVRNEASYMITDTTSSDCGYLSDQSIEWPVPPASRSSQNTVKAIMSGLQETPSSANRGVANLPRGPTASQLKQYGVRTSSLRPPPYTSLGPIAKTKATPGTEQENDLFSGWKCEGFRVKKLSQSVY